MKKNHLGCVEFAVPGSTLEDKLGALESRGMWLELANDGKKSLGEIREALSSHSVAVKSVQAYRQHELQLLGADGNERKLARQHVKKTIEMAAKLGAENTVVVIGYGDPKVKAAGKTCLKIFKDFGKLGEELGVIVSIEPLGAKTSFLPRTSDVLRLVKDVGSNNVRLLIDTMHVWSTWGDPAQTIMDCSGKAEEIQLRDTDSKPPGAGEIDFGEIMKLIEKFSGLVCMEYRPGQDPEEDFELACKTCGVTTGG
jgi:sugar phosphate isomerase/epimerase